MKNLHIAVIDKKAIYQKRDGAIVCGNSDYQLALTFDSEWDAYPEKTARFITNGKREDVTFTGTTCHVPVLSNTDVCIVGVFAGELSTTPVAIPCIRSILCEGG